AAALLVHRFVERPLSRWARDRLDPGAAQNGVRPVPAPVPTGPRAD
ncbi:acyltransferase, partial [Methylobacterium sp. WL18]